jgi:hypothetical protein
VRRLARAVAEVTGRAWAAIAHCAAKTWHLVLRCVGFSGSTPSRPRPTDGRQSTPDPGTHRASRQEARLVRECEAFLAGRYSARLPRRFRWQWSWLNTLAHAEKADIEALASRRPGKHTGAAVFAAGELLRAHERDGWELSWFQREFLVPLELDCMRGRVRGPVATVGGVLDALHRARPGAKPATSRDRSRGGPARRGAVS